MRDQYRLSPFSLQPKPLKVHYMATLASPIEWVAVIGLFPYRQFIPRTEDFLF
jgi:hypothetical protein